MRRNGHERGRAASPAAGWPGVVLRSWAGCASALARCPRAEATDRGYTGVPPEEPEDEDLQAAMILLNILKQEPHR
jgi:hypothetical protein